MAFFIVTFGSCQNAKADAQLLHEDDSIISYQTSPTDKIEFFLKDQKGEYYKDFDRIRQSLMSKNIELKFACNGGMYKKDGSPQGLYIEHGEQITKLDTATSGYGNFYLSPNGVFYLNKDKSGHIIQTSNFRFSEEIEFATQSGPMLLIDSEIHPKFRKGSNNLNIRNGVGVLPNGNLLFAMSMEKINLHDFANYFKMNSCSNALYLDGFVSKMYYPPFVDQKSGNFGVIIGVY